jgi:hypothetical protein
MDASLQFRIEEFRALRAELLYQIQDIDNTKFWVAAAMAGYYSFIAAKFLKANRNRVDFMGPIWIWAPPVVIPIVGLLRQWAHVSQLELFSEYIQKIETLFPNLAGWEHYYRANISRDTVWNYDEFFFFALFACSAGLLAFRWKFDINRARSSARRRRRVKRA